MNDDGKLDDKEILLEGNQVQHHVPDRLQTNASIFTMHMLIALKDDMKVIIYEHYYCTL